MALDITSWSTRQLGRIRKATAAADIVVPDEEEDTMTLRDIIRTVRRPAQTKGPAKHPAGEGDAFKIIPTKGRAASRPPGRWHTAEELDSSSDEELVRMSQCKRKRKCKDLNDILGLERPIKSLPRSTDARKVKKSEPSCNSKGLKRAGAIGSTAEGGRRGVQSSHQQLVKHYSNGILENSEPHSSSADCKSDEMKEMMEILKSFSESVDSVEPTQLRKMARMDGQGLSACSITHARGTREQKKTGVPVAERPVFADVTYASNALLASRHQESSKLSEAIPPDDLPVSRSGLHTCEDAKNCQNACVARAVAPNLDHMSEEELIYWYQEVTGKKFVSRIGEKVRGRIRRLIRAEVKRVAASSNSVNNGNPTPGSKTKSSGKLVVDLELLDSLAIERPVPTVSEEDSICLSESGRFELKIDESFDHSLQDSSKGNTGSLQALVVRLDSMEGGPIEGFTLRDSDHVAPSGDAGVGNGFSEPAENTPIVTVVSQSHASQQMQDIPLPRLREETTEGGADLSCSADSGSRHPMEPCSSASQQLQDISVSKLQEESTKGGAVLSCPADNGSLPDIERFSSLVSFVVPGPYSPAEIVEPSTARAGGSPKLQQAEEVEISSADASTGGLDPELTGGLEFRTSDAITSTDDVNDYKFQFARADERGEGSAAVHTSYDLHAAMDDHMGENPATENESYELLSVKDDCKREGSAAEITSYDLQAAMDDHMREESAAENRSYEFLAAKDGRRREESAAEGASYGLQAAIDDHTREESAAENGSYELHAAKDGRLGEESAALDVSYDLQAAKEGQRSAEPAAKNAKYGLQAAIVEHVREEYSAENGSYELQAAREDCMREESPAEDRSYELQAAKDDHRRAESAADYTSYELQSANDDHTRAEPAAEDTSCELRAAMDDHIREGSAAENRTYKLQAAEEDHRRAESAAENASHELQAGMDSHMREESDAENGRYELQDAKDGDRVGESAAESSNKLECKAGSYDLDREKESLVEDLNIWRRPESTDSPGGERSFGLPIASQQASACPDEQDGIEGNTEDPSMNVDSRKQAEFSKDYESQHSTVSLDSAVLVETADKMSLVETSMEVRSHDQNSASPLKVTDNMSKDTESVPLFCTDEESRPSNDPEVEPSHPSKVSETFGDEYGMCDIMGFQASLEGDYAKQDRVLSLEEYIAGHQLGEISSPDKSFEDVYMQDVDEGLVANLGDDVFTANVRENGTEFENDLAVQEMDEDAPLKQTDEEAPVEGARGPGANNQEEEDVDSRHIVDVSVQELAEAAAAQQGNEGVAFQHLEGEAALPETQNGDEVRVGVHSSGQDLEEDTAAYTIVEVCASQLFREAGCTHELTEGICAAQVAEDVTSEHLHGELPLQQTQRAEPQAEADGNSPNLGDFAAGSQPIREYELAEEFGAPQNSEDSISQQTKQEFALQRANEYGAQNQEEEGPTQQTAQDLLEQFLDDKAAVQLMEEDSTPQYAAETCKSSLASSGTTQHLAENASVPLLDEGVATQESQSPLSRPRSPPHLAEDEVPNQPLYEDDSSLELLRDVGIQRTQEAAKMQPVSVLNLMEKEVAPQQMGESRQPAPMDPGHLRNASVSQHFTCSSLESPVLAPLVKLTVPIGPGHRQDNAPPPIVADCRNGVVQASNVSENGIVVVRQTIGDAVSSCQPDLLSPGHLQNASVAFDELPESSSLDSSILAQLVMFSVPVGTSHPEDNVPLSVLADHMKGVVQDSNLSETALTDDGGFPVILSQPLGEEYLKRAFPNISDAAQDTIRASASPSLRITGQITRRTTRRITRQSIRPSVKLESVIPAEEETSVSTAQSDVDSIQPVRLDDCAGRWNFLRCESSAAEEAACAPQQSPPPLSFSAVGDKSEHFDNSNSGVRQEEWQDAGKCLNNTEVPFSEEGGFGSSPCRKRQTCDSEDISQREKRAALDVNLLFRRKQGTEAETVQERSSTDSEQIPTPIREERSGRRKGEVDSAGCGLESDAADFASSLSKEMTSAARQQQCAKDRLERLLARERRKASLLHLTTGQDSEVSSRSLAGASEEPSLGSLQASPDCREQAPNSESDAKMAAKPNAGVDEPGCEQKGEGESTALFKRPSKLPSRRKTISPLAQLELLEASNCNSLSNSDSPLQKVPPIRLKFPAGYARHHGGGSDMDHKLSTACRTLSANTIHGNLGSANGMLLSLDSSDEDTEDSLGSLENGSKCSGEEPVRKLSLALSPTSYAPQSVSNDSCQETRVSPSINAASFKGILKNGPLPCKGLCNCAECTTQRKREGTASDFVASQMKNFQLIAGQLTEEMQGLRTLIEANISSSGNAEEILMSLKKSKDVEVAADKNLASLLRDCKRYCKLTAKRRLPLRRIVFADEAGKALCQVKTFQSKTLPRSLWDIV